MSPEFLITSLIVVAAPGTGVLYTLAAGLSRGSTAAVAAAFGCTLGILPHLGASILGLAAILHSSAALFQVVKFAGVAYLLYLAWCALREKGALSTNTEDKPQKNMGSIALTGGLINILNPKLSIFFLAFLPQFIPAQNPAPTLTMISLGGVFMAMTFVIFVLYGIFAASLRNQVLSRPHIMKWFNRGIAGAFTALSVKLALTER